jgi:hypothetical protein
VLIRQLVEMGVRNFKVVDRCCTTACSPTANTTARVTELRKVTEKDGIHFTAEGHQNLAKRCTSCIKTLIEGTVKEPRHITFFWRGFKSTVGSKRIAAHRQHSIRGHNARGRGMQHGGRGSASLGRSMSQGFHPFRRY